MSGDRQLGLFPASTVRQPPSRNHRILARRVARRVTARGPISEADLRTELGVGWSDLRLAIGIAAQWRRVDRADGWIIPVAPREEAGG